ncbi:MAG: hypothetical protein VKO64_01660 [Candidatus Sericytochromatia bacterium]|nr:hypothetical protein [Candidatus Sericytochromatia bacterium]
MSEYLRHSGRRVRELLLASAVMLGTAACAQSVPQLYSNAFTRSTSLELAVDQSPGVDRVITLDASGSPSPPTNTLRDLVFRFSRIEGSIPFILYWVLEVEGPRRGEGDATFSVIPAGFSASTESIYIFSLGDLARDDSPVGLADTAVTLQRTYNLRAVWENSLLQSNLTTRTPIRITVPTTDGDFTRTLNLRNTDDAKAYLDAKWREARSNLWGVGEDGFTPGSFIDGLLLYPSTASAELLNPVLNNARDTPTITFTLKNTEVTASE